MIFLWKLSQGLVSGYDINVSGTYSYELRPSLFEKGKERLPCLERSRPIQLHAYYHKE